MPNEYQFKNQINQLIRNGLDVEAAKDCSYICVHNYDLPGNGIWTDSNKKPIRTTSMLIDIPYDFPLSPPRGHAFHLSYIEYNGKRLSNFYSCQHHPWYYICFSQFNWDPKTSNLLTLFSVIEVSISDRIKNL